MRQQADYVSNPQIQDVDSGGLPADAMSRLAIAARLRYPHFRFNKPGNIGISNSPGTPCCSAVLASPLLRPGWLR
jgi:hypothetical protein